MKRWAPFLPIVVVVLLAGLFAFYALRRDNSRIEPNFTVGKPAPELTLAYLEGGGDASLKEITQGPALVNLFASWCTPCIVENPYLMEMQAKGVRIIGLAQRDTRDKTAEFLVKWGDPYAIVLDDPTSRGTIEFGATGVPETFVIDSKGMIVGKHTGPLENETQVAALMAKLEAAN